MTAPALTSESRAPTFDLKDFTLPGRLEADSPPEERGSGRDDVRLMVSFRSSGAVEHRRFPELPEILESGDLLVVNISATLPAALHGRVGRRPVLLHLSTPAGARDWIVELRHPDLAWRSSTPWLDARPGTVVVLPDRGRAVLLDPRAGDPRKETSGCGRRVLSFPLLSIGTWPTMVDPSAMAMWALTARSRRIRQCSQKKPVARKCHRRPVLSRRSSSRDSCGGGSALLQCCFIPACHHKRHTRCRWRNASPSPP